jgi:hypothetical protein
MKTRILVWLLLTPLFGLLLSQAGYAQFFHMVSATPKNGAMDVPVDTPIVIRFNHSVRTASVPRRLLYEVTTAKEVPVSLQFTDGDEAIVLIPQVPLMPGTQYIINLAGISSTFISILHHDACTILFTTKGGQFMAVPYVTPAEVTLPPGGFVDATYNFIEGGGGLAEILQILLLYEDGNGRQISKAAEEVKFLIRSNQSTKHRATVSVPAEVGSFAMGQTIMVRRIFIGVDQQGNRVELKTGTKVNVANPSSPALRISDIAVRVPDFGMMVPKDSIIAAEALIKGAGSGDIHGSWSLDGQPLSFFVAKMHNSETVNVQAAEKAFAAVEGKHTLCLQLITPEKKSSEEIIYLVSASPGTVPVLLKPPAGQVFSSMSGTPPVFRWSQNPQALAYRIAVGKSRAFKPDEWVKTDSNMWNPDWVKWSALGPGTFFWAVKPVLLNNQEGPASEPATFTIKSTP